MLVHAGLLLKTHKDFQQLTQDTMESDTYLPVMILSLDKLFGIIRRLKRAKEFTSFLKIIRRRYPNERRLIVILDNFSPHKKKEVFNWCRRSGVWLIFTATNASWMNRIEAQFGLVSYFVLKSSYPKNHVELEQNVKEHLKWRNNNSQNSLLKILQKKTYVI